MSEPVKLQCASTIAPLILELQSNIAILGIIRIDIAQANRRNRRPRQLPQRINKTITHFTFHVDFLIEREALYM